MIPQAPFPEVDPGQDNRFRTVMREASGQQSPSEMEGA
jgi:hypothetical protein